MRRAGYTQIFTPRFVVGSLFFLGSWAVAREFLEVTPTESRWFWGFTLAFFFAGAARIAQLYGKEKQPSAREIFSQAFATGLGAMGVLYAATVVIPKLPNPEHPSFLAAMVAGGSLIGVLGIEFFVGLAASWKERKQREKGGG